MEWLIDNYGDIFMILFLGGLGLAVVGCGLILFAIGISAIKGAIKE